MCVDFRRDGRLRASVSGLLQCTGVTPELVLQVVISLLVVSRFTFHTLESRAAASGCATATGSAGGTGVSAAVSVTVSALPVAGMVWVLGIELFFQVRVGMRRRNAPNQY